MRVEPRPLVFNCTEERAYTLEERIVLILIYAEDLCSWAATLSVWDSLYRSKFVARRNEFLEQCCRFVLSVSRVNVGETFVHRFPPYVKQFENLLKMFKHDQRKKKLSFWDSLLKCKIFYADTLGQPCHINSWRQMRAPILRQPEHPYRHLDRFNIVIVCILHCIFCSISLTFVKGMTWE